MLPEYDYNFYPIRKMETCENKKLEDFSDIVNTFTL